MSNRVLLSWVLFLFLLKIFAVSFTSFNLFGDEAQYWLWSKDLDYGYFSKPPFLSWFISFYTFVFGDGFFSIKSIPIIVYFVISYSLYLLSKNIGLKPKEAFSYSLLFLIIPAVSFSSFIVSTDIFLLLFWTLALNELVIIKKKQSLKSFLVFGIMLGLAFLSKYAAIYFVICLVVYFLIDKKFRFLVYQNYYGFFLSLICVILILMPNIIWNLNNGWVTFNHTVDNANLNNTKINILRGFEFVFIQILMVGPFLFLGNVLNYKKLIIKDNQKLLLIFSLPIFLIVFFEAVIVRANANWAAPALISFFLFLVIGINKKSIFRKLNLYFNIFLCLVFFSLVGIGYKAEIFNRIVGLNNFSNDIYYMGSELGISDYVVSNRLLFSSFGYELKDKNFNLHMPYKNGLEITNHFQISSPLKEEMSRNFILIGSLNEINYLKNSFKAIEKNPPKYDFTNEKLTVYEIVFN